MSAAEPLTGLLPDALRERMAAIGEPRYRAEQVFRAIWREAVTDPRAMTTLPAALRERLAGEHPAAATREVAVQEARDGTTKWLLELADGRRVETVMIPERDRRTVCVSTQVGCPIACIFCASGVGGLVRNLSPAEIAEQVLHVRRRLGERPSHVVVMGMGEPLLNLPHLASAIRIWMHEDGMAFSPRRITVSTAGTAPMIDRLLAQDLGVNLAISLHGPDDAVRRDLVPTSREGRVADLVEAGTRYAAATGRDVTVEYVLVRGRNDAPEHAETLGTLLAGRHLHVNLIPLNPVRHRPDLAPPSGLEARAFVRRLRDHGVSATLRTQHGEDIDAACGQLALERAIST